MTEETTSLNDIRSDPEGMMLFHLHYSRLVVLHLVAKERERREVEETTRLVP